MDHGGSSSWEHIDTLVMGETEDEEMNMTLEALQLDCVVVCLKAQSYLEQGVGFRKNVCQIVFFLV